MTTPPASASPRWLVGRPLSPGLRIAAMTLLAVAVAAVGFIVLTPGPPDNAGQESLRIWLDTLHAEGKLPGFITFGLVEWSSNVLMFVPIGFLLAAGLSPARRIWAPATGAVMSTAIELSQKVWLPSRVSSVGDVLANTSGALLGMLILVAGSCWAGRARR